MPLLRAYCRVTNLSAWRGLSPPRGSEDCPLGRKGGPEKFWPNPTAEARPLQEPFCPPSGADPLSMRYLGEDLPASPVRTCRRHPSRRAAYPRCSAVLRPRRLSQPRSRGHASLLSQAFPCAWSAAVASRSRRRSSSSPASSSMLKTGPTRGGVIPKSAIATRVAAVTAAPP